MNKMNTTTQVKQNAEEKSFDCLEVTGVNIYPIKEAMGKTKAFARVVINEQLQLTGLRVLDGSNGLFVSYPNDPSYKGEDYRSLFYPLTRELREHIEKKVIEKFDETMKE